MFISFRAETRNRGDLNRSKSSIEIIHGGFCSFKLAAMKGSRLPSTLNLPPKHRVSFKSEGAKVQKLLSLSGRNFHFSRVTRFLHQIQFSIYFPNFVYRFTRNFLSVNNHSFPDIKLIQFTDLRRDAEQKVFQQNKKVCH